MNSKGFQSDKELQNFQIDGIKSGSDFDCNYSIIIKRKNIPISTRKKRILVSNSDQDNPGFSNKTSSFGGNEAKILEQFEIRFLEQSQTSLTSGVQNLTSDFRMIKTGSRVLEVNPSNVLKVSISKLVFDDNPNDGSSGTLSTGALVGAIVGGLVFSGVLIFFIICCIIKKKKQGKKGKKGKQKAQTKVKVFAKHVEANSPASHNNPQHANPKPENLPVQSPLSRNTNFTEHSLQTPGSLPMTPNGRFSHYPMYYGHPGFPQGQGQGQGQYDPSGMGLPPNSVSSNNRGSVYPNTPSPYMAGGFNPHNPNGNSLNMNMPGINQIPQDFAPEKAQGQESELRMYEINVGDVATYGQKK